jgi:predicted CXXCH cytochrome family protein
MLALGLFALLFLGCSTPQKRYQVLSFFFDGVPDPSAPSRASASKVSSSGKRTVVHKPYADNQCNSCHLNTSDIFARAQVREDLCISCHGGTPVQYAVMHGPVVNNACQMCHVPHSSALPHLLRQPSPAVCTQCHEPAGLALMHKRPLDPTASCIDCHSGHGGSDHRMLLSLAPQPAAKPDNVSNGTEPTIVPRTSSPTPATPGSEAPQ